MDRSFTYNQYQSYFEQLVKDGKTSGDNQSESLINYTKLNWSRAKRGDKTFSITSESESFLNALNSKYKFTVITEPWCGDAAQIVPAIAGLANASDKIDLEVVLRDENEDLIDAHLTNGGKSIPITIVYDAETGEELTHWGPRPKEAQEKVMAYKNTPDDLKQPFDEFVTELQQWYNNDKTVSIQKEFLQEFKEAIAQ